MGLGVFMFLSSAPWTAIAEMLLKSATSLDISAKISDPEFQKAYSFSISFLRPSISAKAAE
jgi:hypothetical protein